MTFKGFFGRIIRVTIYQKGMHFVQVIKMQKFYGLITAFAEGEQAAEEAANQSGGAAAMISSFLPLIIMIAIFYFMLIRPQQKKEKKFREMLAALKTGDKIITSSGIEGKIISVKDDEVVVETGADRIKLTFKKWAIKEVITLEA